MQNLLDPSRFKAGVALRPVGIFSFCKIQLALTPPAFSVEANET